MGTMKIARGVYQYPAVGNCFRFHVLAVYSRRNARNTLLFIENGPLKSETMSVNRTDNGTIGGIGGAAPMKVFPDVGYGAGIGASLSTTSTIVFSSWNDLFGHKK
jgi:hypothetical protein